MKKALTVLAITSTLTFASALVLTGTLQASTNATTPYVTQPHTPEIGTYEPSRQVSFEQGLGQTFPQERDAPTSATVERNVVEDTSSASTISGNLSAEVGETPAYPVRLRISTIGLNDPVVSVGLNRKGEMDVPSGKTSNVGWYSPGTVPGAVGSAVMDAHVFAAFANLHKLHVGDIVEVLMSDNSILRFKITEMTVYPLAQVPAQRLFTSEDGKHLNLITCAGKLVPDHSTYDHRLIVYTTLVE